MRESLAACVSAGSRLQLRWWPNYYCLSGVVDVSLSSVNSNASSSSVTFARHSAMPLSISARFLPKSPATFPFQKQLAESLHGRRVIVLVPDQHEGH
jgi:hypothetical protein